MDAPTPRSLGICGSHSWRFTSIQQRTHNDYWTIKKGVRTPEYYDGANMTYYTEFKCWTMSIKTYVKNVCDRISKLLEVVRLTHEWRRSPQKWWYRSTVWEWYLTLPNAYRLCPVGSTLGRFDVQYATNTLARYASMPRKGHFHQCLRLFGYLQHNPMGRIKFDSSDPNLTGDIF